MSHATLSLFTAVLATGSPQLEEKSPNAATPESTVERGSPALFSWGDADGDARLDLAAVSAEGVLQLLANTGEGRFEDVSERVGLSGIANAALALWVDYDADGRLDLFVGARAGASRLFHNEGSLFVDMTAASGLASEGAVQSAHWLDHDGDGRLDLHVVTVERSELYRGLEGGFFERTELPLADASRSPLPGGSLGAEEAGAPLPPTTSSAGDESPGGNALDGRPMNAGRSPSIHPISGGRTSGPSGMAPLAPSLQCVPSLEDQAQPGACLQASTTPALGRLYPLSTNLFVALGGNVGIGTTSPSAKLDVAGTARVTDTLTLAPSGDQALEVSTGSIYKGGALFIHTKGGGGNTALGSAALYSVTTGTRNTASGSQALFDNTTGSQNTANGYMALRRNTTGSNNTASGFVALFYNTTGSRNTASGVGALGGNTTGFNNTASGYQALQYNWAGRDNTAIGFKTLHQSTTGVGNTASGYRALSSNTTGHYNTASGHRALFSNTTGERNIALGLRAGYNVTVGADNIHIGNTGVLGDSSTIRMGSPGSHLRVFIAGIRGQTTGVANAIPVLIDSNGQLGTVSSSRRFKEEIVDMGDRTERLLALRPVVFRYKSEVQSGERPLEYGLIAEEVAEVFPELVVHDEDGKPFTVKYHLLSAMLLNELQELDERLGAREGDHARELEELRERLAALEASAAATAAVEPR